MKTYEFTDKHAFLCFLEKLVARYGFDRVDHTEVQLPHGVTCYKVEVSPR